MLSGAEQRRLAEIETALRMEDPRFVRRFDPRRRVDRWRRRLALFAIVVGVGVVVVALAVESVVVAVNGH